MGLLDYYKQFEGLSEEEVNGGLREEAAERKRKALTQVQNARPLADHLARPAPRRTSSTRSPSRRPRGLQRYPHLRGSQLRRSSPSAMVSRPRA